MTTLYRPVLIESTGQAASLPIGTTATNAETTRSGTWHAPPRVNIGRGLWSGDDLYGSVGMVGWTALVPIEAEEEETEEIQVYLGVAHIGPRAVTPAPSRRLVTPWEEA